MAPMRGHGEGSLFKLSRPTAADPTRVVWIAEVSLPDGRRRRRQAPTMAAARAALAAMQKAVSADALDGQRERLGPFLLRWANEEHGWAPATARKHESIVRVHLVPAIGHVRLPELSVGAVEALFNGLDPQTARHVRSTLRRAIADAQRDGLVGRNVAALARPPKLPHRERTILDAAEARQLIDSTRGTRYGPLWVVLVTTGLRISEALGLAWSDVDLGAPAIHVRRTLQRVDGEWQRRPTKTDKSRRSIPLTAIAVEALRAQRAQQDQDRGTGTIDGLVFTTDRGHPIHATNLLPRLRADLAAAGLPRVGLHDLRHSAATILYSLGVPLPTIADWLGHSTVRVTQDLYRHRVAELQRDAADRLQAALR